MGTINLVVVSTCQFLFKLAYKFQNKFVVRVCSAFFTIIFTQLLQKKKTPHYRLYVYNQVIFLIKISQTPHTKDSLRVLPSVSAVAECDQNRRLKFWLSLQENAKE